MERIVIDILSKEGSFDNLAERLTAITVGGNLVFNAKADRTWYLGNPSSDWRIRQGKIIDSEGDRCCLVYTGNKSYDADFPEALAKVIKNLVPEVIDATARRVDSARRY